MSSNPTPSLLTDGQPDAAGATLRDVPLAQIRTSPTFAYRIAVNAEPLAASMRAHGQLQPGFARPMPDGTVELIDGNRRLAAARAMGAETLALLVVPMSDEQARVLAWSGNTERLSPDATDKVAFVLSAHEVGVSTAELGRLLGWTKPYTERMSKSAHLPETLREASHAHGLQLGHMAVLATNADLFLPGASGPVEHVDLLERVRDHGLGAERFEKEVLARRAELATRSRGMRPALRAAIERLDRLPVHKLTATETRKLLDALEAHVKAARARLRATTRRIGSQA